MIKTAPERYLVTKFQREYFDRCMPECIIFDIEIYLDLIGSIANTDLIQRNCKGSFTTAIVLQRETTAQPNDQIPSICVVLETAANIMGGGAGGLRGLRKFSLKFLRHFFGMLIYQIITKILYFCKMTGFSSTN